MRTWFITSVCFLTLLLSPWLAKAAAISPSVVELESLPGEVLESSFTILNTGASEQTYFLDRLAFESNGEDAAPLFTPEKTNQSEFLSWIDFPLQEVLVPALSKVDVPFLIAIPDDIPAGSYYGAITVSTAPTDIVTSNGATIEAKTAVLVFLTVKGETVEKLELLDFDFEQRSSSLPFGTFRYRVQNQGNVYLSPVGEIKLVGLFGQTIATVDINKSEGRVLPSSTRTYKVELNSEEISWLDVAGYQLRHLVAGSVKAQLNLTFGKEGSITAQSVIWVIPWQLMSLLVAGVLVVVLFYKKIARQ